MKRLNLIILLLSIMQIVIAQPKSAYIVDEYGNPVHYEIDNDYRRCNMFFVVDSSAKDVKFFRNFSNGHLTDIFLLKGAKFTGLESRVHKDSLDFYRYSVIENGNKILVSDAVFRKVKYRWGQGTILPNQVTVDLGTFSIKDRKLEVKIYRVDKPKNVTSVVLYNRSLIAPSQLSYELLHQESKAIIKDNTKIKVNRALKGLRITRKKTDLDLLYDVAIENVDKHSINFDSPNWNDVPGTQLVVADIKSYFLVGTGKYTISVYPRTQMYSHWRDNSLAKGITFTVQSIEERRFSGKELGTYIGYTCAGLGLLFSLVSVYIRRKNKRKLMAEQQQKQIAQLKLDSVRSQLNPHFLFNALAGIQNLMNKNENETASTYLRKFARLTRSVLDNKELISLREEKSLLDDYLQMEQLRFGFNYKIIVSENIDIDNTEIPGMLIQPFLENSIKHGICEKGNDGIIEVRFEKQLLDLKVLIVDNGDGFDVNKSYDGLGLALSRNRIFLHNAVFKISPITLDINSGERGTTVNITLSQWM
jgi:two-component system LytT family sensor kinase